MRKDDIPSKGRGSESSFKPRTAEVSYRHSSPKEISLTPVDAHLLFVDGHTIKVRVPNPPPLVFELAQSPAVTRVLLLRTYSERGAVYIERDRRKSSVAVEADRRKRRADS
jgi:hypothetical protein